MTRYEKFTLHARVVLLVPLSVNVFLLRVDVSNVQTSASTAVNMVGDLRKTIKDAQPQPPSEVRAPAESWTCGPAPCDCEFKAAARGFTLWPNDAPQCDSGVKQRLDDFRKKQSLKR